MSIASPDFNFFRDAAKPLKVKGVVLDRLLNVGNSARQELLGNREANILNGVLMWGGTGSTSTSFIVDGSVAASTTMIGGVAYVGGRRFVVPKETLSLGGTTDYIYVNENGRFAVGSSAPTSPHCPVVFIDTLQDPGSGNSHYARVWGNGFEGNGIYFGFGFDPLDFTTPGVARTFTLGGTVSFSGNVDITGNLTVLGNFTQYDTTHVVDNLVVGDHDKITFGIGAGTLAAPTGDFGFQWSHATTPTYGTAILGLSPDNQRLIIAEDTDFTTADADTTFDALQTDIAAHAAFASPNVTIPDIVFTNGALLNTSHLTMNFERMVTGSTATDATYAFTIDSTQHTTRGIHITAGHALRLTTGASQNIQMSPAGIVNITGAITASGLMTASNALTVSSGTTTTGAITATGTVDITGALTQDTGAVTLTADAASSLTTSTGALTLTSAAAATWSSGAGNLTVQGAGSLFLRGNGASSTRMEVTSSGFTLAPAGAVGITLTAAQMGIAHTTHFTIQGPASPSNLLINAQGTGSVIVEGMDVLEHVHGGGTDGDNVPWGNISGKPDGYISLTAADFLARNGANDIFEPLPDTSGGGSPYVEGYGNIGVLKWNENQNNPATTTFAVPPDATATQTLTVIVKASCESATGIRDLTIDIDKTWAGKTVDTFSAGVGTRTLSFAFDSSTEDGWQTLNGTLAGQTVSAGDIIALQLIPNTTGADTDNILVVGSVVIQYAKA